MPHDVEMQALWLRLLTQVEHMLDEIRRPAADRLFRALGPRRLRMAQRQLEHERDLLLRAGVEMDLAVAADEACRAAEGLALCDDLVEDYRTLAEHYHRAAHCADARGDLARARWLQGRAALHAEKSRFLRG